MRHATAGGVLLAAIVAILLPTMASGACTPSATKLCIDDTSGDKRFEVRVTYQTVLGGGHQGDGQAIPLGSLGVNRGGLFWFFSADNPEMQVKILNGCSVNQSYWVFLTAGTNVGYEVTIVDTLRSRTKTYRNTDQTPAAPVQEINAFACP